MCSDFAQIYFLAYFGEEEIQIIQHIMPFLILRKDD